MKHSNYLILRLLNTIIILGSGMLFLVACSDSTTPKPRGYFRIDLPEREYRSLDSIFPYTFEYPVYAGISRDIHAPAEANWINIDFPRFKGRLHLSYKKVNKNLSTFTEDAHSLVMKHIPKASAIEEVRIENPDNRVFGLIYDIKGTGAASPYQFYVMDSATHFLRGALYFDVIPNNDSLAPVIDFIKGDIQHMLETMKWK
ncbi:MAG: gliding motility lipoprotein GldD [Bacteroidota bacterium]